MAKLPLLGFPPTDQLTDQVDLEVSYGSTWSVRGKIIIIYFKDTVYLFII